MTTHQTDPTPRNEAGQTQNGHQQNGHGQDLTNADPIDESIDESMAEADRANGEGDPVDTQIQGINRQEDKPKAMRRAD